MAVRTTASAYEVPVSGQSPGVDSAQVDCRNAGARTLLSMAVAGYCPVGNDAGL